MRKALLATLALCACAGANLNRRTSGNRNGGIAIAHHEIAVDPKGTSFLVRQGSELLVGDLTTHTLERVDGIANPELLAFWPSGSGFYAYSWQGRELLSYDLASRQVVWRQAFDSAGPKHTRLDVTPDGSRVILTRPRVVFFFDALSGAGAGTFESANTIEDLDVTGDSRRILVTENEVWGKQGPETAVHVLSLEGERLCTARVPNCADELVVDADGQRAYLAPTFCAADPVSVIDVTDDCRFVKNLPGFGPIALTPDGTTGVAFLDRDARDPNAPPRPKEVDASDSRFHLMLFDTRTFELHTLPVGAKLPRYALTPDGTMVLVDGLAKIVSEEKTKKSERFRIEPSPTRVVDVATRTERIVEGPAVMLNAFVLEPGAQHAWVVYGARFETDDKELRPLDVGLYALDIPAARVERVPLPFSPIALNSTPGGATLILRDENQIHLFDPATRQVTATFPRL